MYTPSALIMSHLSSHERYKHITELCQLIERSYGLFPKGKWTIGSVTVNTTKSFPIIWYQGVRYECGKLCLVSGTTWSHDKDTDTMLWHSTKYNAMSISAYDHALNAIEKMLFVYECSCRCMQIYEDR